MEENQNQEQNITSNDAILTEIRDLSKKRLFYQKISTCCIAGMLAILLICVLVIVPKVNATIVKVNGVATKADMLDENGRVPGLRPALLADAIATACPLCFSTFRRYSERPVRDIAEVIDAQIR